MIAVPTVLGRKLPLGDWEGDDPAAFVTCTATSAGRAVAFATNGRIVKDGSVYYAAAPHNVGGGQSLEQAWQAITTVAKLPLTIPSGWQRKDVTTHLRYARGLIVQGRYSAIPRAYRYQAFADFDHAMWFSHMSSATGNFRCWNPLNPRTHEYGEWYPAAVFWAFAESLNFSVAYVPLQSL
jgi:hypothetical protein